MAKNDIKIYDEGAFGYPGDDSFVVASGANASINVGEPVAKALAGTAVTALATNKPVVATDYLAGIAASTSTDTTTANGIVKVMPLTSGITYLISPKVAATWNTQAKYDALVGSRVLFDLTGGVYTILAADGATYGLVIEPLDITKYPGKVRFSIRNGCSYLS